MRIINCFFFYGNQILFHIFMTLTRKGRGGGGGLEICHVFADSFFFFFFIVFFVFLVGGAGRQKISHFFVDVINV